MSISPVLITRKKIAPLKPRRPKARVTEPFGCRQGTPRPTNRSWPHAPRNPTLSNSSLLAWGREPDRSVSFPRTPPWETARRRPAGSSPRPPPPPLAAVRPTCPPGQQIRRPARRHQRAAKRIEVPRAWAKIWLRPGARKDTTGDRPTTGKQRNQNYCICQGRERRWNHGSCSPLR